MAVSALGFGDLSDAYFAAQAVPLIPLNLLSGYLTTTQPVSVARDGYEAAIRRVKSGALYVALVACMLAATSQLQVGMLFDFENTGHQVATLTSVLLWLLLPVAVLVAGIAGAELAAGRYLIASLSNLVPSIGVIAGGLLAIRLEFAPLASVSSLVGGRLAASVCYVLALRLSVRTNEPRYEGAEIRIPRQRRATSVALLVTSTVALIIPVAERSIASRLSVEGLITVASFGTLLAASSSHVLTYEPAARLTNSLTSTLRKGSTTALLSEYRVALAGVLRRTALLVALGLALLVALIQVQVHYWSSVLAPDPLFYWIIIAYLLSVFGMVTGTLSGRYLYVIDQSILGTKAAAWGLSCGILLGLAAMLLDSGGVFVVAALSFWVVTGALMYRTVVGTGSRSTGGMA